MKISRKYTGVRVSMNNFTLGFNEQGWRRIIKVYTENRSARINQSWKCFSVIYNPAEAESFPVSEGRIKENLLARWKLLRISTLMVQKGSIYAPVLSRFIHCLVASKDILPVKQLALAAYFKCNIDRKFASIVSHGLETALVYESSRAWLIYGNSRP